jgi:hypothetical protein
LSAKCRPDREGVGESDPLFAVALTTSELALVERAVRQLVSREGRSQTSSDVLDLTTRPLRVGELGELGERIAFPASTEPE